MPYTPNHFGTGYTLIRHNDPLFQQVDPVKPEPLSESIPLPEVTDSDFAAFEELTGRKA